MSTAPVTANPLEETDKLLVKFEKKAIPDDYRAYYGAKRNNFFASIQSFWEMWNLYHRLDAIWLRGFKDLNIARDPNTMFPLLLYFNAHAKIRVAPEHAFAGCMPEARSIHRSRRHRKLLGSTSEHVFRPVWVVSPEALDIYEGQRV